MSLQAGDIRWARAAASRRIEEQEGAFEGFEGAFLFGSAAALQDDVPLPPGSDVDLAVVLSSPGPEHGPGKLLQDGVLLDVTYLPRSELASPELVLSHYHLGPNLCRARLVTDPAGW